MPPDEGRVAEARSWLLKATGDLRAAEVDLAARPPLLEDVVFPAQQAAEKALKGFLTWHLLTFRKTHNLVELGEACAAVDHGLESLLARAAPLTEYAWKFRYPGDIDMPSIDEASQALAISREVVDAILERLPQETHP